ncbi:Arginyl-tRNA--protein transferase 1 [Coemansia sp. RSA 455]|nr:Arginyl-tRNA--protein transferase 1 [Coemansia sp. S680]KAJ2042720.1 Arginyl-tRNA--protein transferase 1 [Coemansia sp. S2]KAJ2249389.1 Arginyl-tRNA--protein transferase 1 [Coemansia sp. RSA 455]KAJ2465630.1 Arginyl-tRNA--protein transferase 1 [Coemansia sp. RSA 2337]
MSAVPSDTEHSYLEDASSSCLSSSYDSDCSYDDSQVMATTNENKQSHLRLLGMQSRSTCGYCGTVDGSRFLAMRAVRLTCDDYQALIDRGWRRAGSLLYLTDHSDACCAYYTIRCHALDHVLSTSDKKLLRKIRRHISPAVTTNNDLLSRVCEIEQGGNLEVRLEPASFSEEKFGVFEKYQVAVHDDQEVSRQGFRRFLCDSPLLFQKLAQTEDQVLPVSGLGSYHQCYYVGGQLAAVGVLDILPSCVSSVYLFYDPEFSYLSLGTFSALREIALVRQLQCALPNLQYYYMGYYIPSCPKMTYKGRWRPADLLDLRTFKWIPIERCLERIARYPVFCTFDPDVDKLAITRERKDQVLDLVPAISPELLTPEQQCRALEQMEVLVDIGGLFGAPTRIASVSGSQLTLISDELEELALQTYVSVGEQLATHVTLSL